MTVLSITSLQAPSKITEAHVQECLSKAYLQAIVARARMTVHFRNVDYGVDGTFCEVQITKRRRAETGFAINFQSKASIDWKIENGMVIYDLDVKNYNDLARISRSPGTVPSILILFCMPSDSGKWLEFSEEELLMRKCSYWMKIDGEDTTNTSTQRVFIPVPPQRRPKQIDSNPLKSKKKSRLILNAILTSIFYSISENFNSIFLGGFEVEQVYSSST